MMRYPIFVKSLIELARNVGLEQQAIAKRLKVSNAAVSQWATGTRPIPRRHLPGFVALISELIRTHDATHHEQLTTYLRSWNTELYVRGDALSEHARKMLHILQSPYAQDDILKLSREERQKLRYACHQLKGDFDALDEFEQGALPQFNAAAVKRVEPAEAHFTRLRKWFGVDEDEGEEEG